MNCNFKKIFRIVLFVLLSSFAYAAFAASKENYKVVDGIAVYIGILPAEIVSGHPKKHIESGMHGGVPKNGNNIHLVVALFNDAKSTRIADASVTATLNEIGLAGETKKLEAMRINDTVTYGNYFEIESNQTYQIVIEIKRHGVAKIIKAEFAHEHFPK